jgi:hypothetical protein
MSFLKNSQIELGLTLILSTSTILFSFLHRSKYFDYYKLRLKTCDCFYVCFINNLNLFIPYITTTKILFMNKNI